MRGLLQRPLLAGRRGHALRLPALLALSAAALLAPGAPAAAGEWVAGDLHVHTTLSHDAYGGPGDDNTGPDEGYTLGHSVSGQFAVGAARGLHYLAVTDHNDVRSQRDAGFGSSGLLGVPGYENSLRGHAQMLGARRVYANGDSSAAAVQAVADALRADGGVFQVNHPAEGSTSFPDDVDWRYAYAVRPDTVETWNISRLYQPPLPSGSSNDDAVRYWEGWLDRGERVGATGGSDNHYLATTAIQGVGQPTTWVWVARRDVRGVLDGLRAGRTFVSDQPPAHGGPRLYLEADGDRDGAYEAMVGDAVAPGSALRVRAEGAPGTFLRVVTDRGAQAFAPVPVAGAAFEHRFTLPRAATWARAELFDPDLAAERGVACNGLVGSGTTYCRNLLLVRAMTSAIYLRTDAGSAPPAAGRAPSGRAALSVPRGCVRRRFRAWVSGRSLAAVAFAVDGRARRSAGRGLVVDPRRMRAGRHRVSARVTFAPRSLTRPRTLTRTFAVCARPARRGPRFTG